VARINTASQRTDLLPWAVAYDAPWAPVIGACAIVVAPPADHPVFALRATTDPSPCPRKRQRRRADDAHAAMRASVRSRLRPWSQAFKIFTYAL
jgi:hypothetical protein